MSDHTDRTHRLSPGHIRDELRQRGIDHAALSDRDANHLAYAMRGWCVIPSTPTENPPIAARVWLAAALSARGRYLAPDRFGHAADLGDDGPLVDAVVLMAVVQRHFLDVAGLDWDDVPLASDLGLEAQDITRAQRLLDRVATLMRRPAALGARWWQRSDSSAEARSTSVDERDGMPFSPSPRRFPLADVPERIARLGTDPARDATTSTTGTKLHQSTPK